MKSSRRFIVFAFYRPVDFELILLIVYTTTSCIVKLQVYIDENYAYAVWNCYPEALNFSSFYAHALHDYIIHIFMLFCA